MFLDDALLVPTQVCLVVAAFNSGQFELNSLGLQVTYQCNF